MKEEMNEKMSDCSYTDMREMLDDLINDVEESSANFHCVPGISTGFLPLDDLMCGFEAGMLYVIGGRTCIGREDFMLSMIKSITLESKQPVLLFSTSHQKKSYVERLLSMHCHIPTVDLHRGHMYDYEWNQLDKRLQTLLDAPLFIHDSVNLPLSEVTETVRNFITEKGIKIVFIDCLQMIDIAKEDKDSSERIARVLLSLKRLACQKDLRIVVGSMLNRGVERRDSIEGMKPLLPDLANSSYIEEIADVVMMVHRPEYYRIYEDENGNDLHGLMEIIVRKNALKPLGSITLYYHQETGVIKISDFREPAFALGYLEENETDIEALENLRMPFDL